MQILQFTTLVELRKWYRDVGHPDIIEMTKEQFEIYKNLLHKLQQPDPIIKII